MYIYTHTYTTYFRNQKFQYIGAFPLSLRVEAKLIEGETKKRIEELVNQRVEQEIERRKEAIEAEILRRVDEAKRAMEEQLLQEIEREKARMIEEARRKQVWNICHVFLSSRQEVTKSWLAS